MATTTERTEHAASRRQGSDADPAARLRLVLRINAGFSALTGLIGLAAGGPVADFLGDDPSADFLGVDQVWLVRLIGLGLLGFAVAVAGVARLDYQRLAAGSRIISFNDFGWVLGTVAVVALGWLSTGGAVAMGLIAVVVLEFGVSQLLARRSMLNALGR
jgi:hypothetical protein